MSNERDTLMGGVEKAFLTTHWSLMEDERAGNEARQVAFVELLVQRYWKPVYCYLCRRGFGNEEVKDLTQGFFQEVVLARNLIDKADRSKGRFRTFLLTALDRYVINVYHKQTTRRHIPPAKLVSMSIGDVAELPEAVTTLTAEDSFTYVWVSALLEEVLAALKAEYEQADRPLHWQVFYERTLRPIMEGGRAFTRDGLQEARPDRHGQGLQYDRDGEEAL